MTTNMNERGQILAIMTMAKVRLGLIEYSAMRVIFSPEQTLWAAQALSNAIERNGLDLDNFLDPRKMV